MTDDIKKLITEAREVQDAITASMLLRTGTDDGAHLYDRLADALEAEHQRAEEWRVLWEKAANGVLTLQAERDALRTAVQDALGFIDKNWLAPFRPGEIGYELRGILSRAIDTKEKP